MALGEVQASPRSSLQAAARPSPCHDGSLVLVPEEVWECVLLGLQGEGLLGVEEGLGGLVVVARVGGRGLQLGVGRLPAGLALGGLRLHNVPGGG